MRFFYLLILSLLSGIGYAQKGVTKTSPPKWVKEIRSDNKILEDNGAYQYLLFDFQDNVAEQSYYRHYSVKALNSEGVQSISDINVTFDPTYQKLQFHQIQIIREGKIIDKLKDSNIQVLQREASMERSLYDGSLSAIINLTDVRKDDIIEYAYTIIGFNPINKGNYSTTFYHESTFPVNRIFNRVILRSQTNINFKLYNGASEPKIVKSNDQIEYTWDNNALEFKLYDNNVPSWFDPYKRVSLSTYNSWKDVVNWALPLYNYSNKEVNNIKNSLKENLSKEAKILELIRIVQDDIRYLGFESGISAYKPNNPSKVFNQKYGDCKDKSLLLVSLLRSEGITAFPLFVNTQSKDQINNQLPSNAIFDHCVVNFNYNGNEYYIDPTISNQGGSFQNISFPAYKSGLLIKPGQTDLTILPKSALPTIVIKETISVDSIGGNADLTVRSEYTGSKADHIRSYFNNDSKESIQKEYLNYYSSLYPNIELANDIKLFDSTRNSSNKVIIEEFYHIKNFWLDAEDKSYIYCEIYPLILESLINYPKTAKRDMPYYLGAPYQFSQAIQIHLPEEWIINPTKKRIDESEFVYENNMVGFGKTVLVNHKYELKKEFISDKAVDLFLKKTEEVQGELSYYLTYNQSLSGFKLSWVSVTFAFLTIILGTIFSVKIYRTYNPPALEQVKNMPIGGWLILPAIGITLSPILLIFQVVSEEYFNHNSWLSFYNSESDQSTGLLLLFGAEIIYNFLYLIFSILVLVLFYKRRTSVPRLIAIYYVIGFLGPLSDLLLVEEIAPEYLTETDINATYKHTVTAFLRAAIWIPYFNISERVKHTFCKKY